MIYITGDTHADFSDIHEFCYTRQTSRDDIMIILGDAGINYWLNQRDRYLKEWLSGFPITFFCIHGNHEARPQGISTYVVDSFHGGAVYFEPEYPNILFAADGNLYDFGDKQYLVIGGAYSIDKYIRINEGLQWFEDEQPSDRTKMIVEMKIDGIKDESKICVLSHTCPLSKMPIEALLPNIDQSKVDNSTEKWLDTIEARLDYCSWYCGHFHIDKIHDSKFRFLANDILCIGE